jgi:hypothetical protein
VTQNQLHERPELFGTGVRQSQGQTSATGEGQFQRAAFGRASRPGRRGQLDEWSRPQSSSALPTRAANSALEIVVSQLQSGGRATEPMDAG